MRKIQNSELINLNNWLNDIVKTVKHIKDQNDVGYFFDKDVATVENCVAQASLSCRRADEFFEECQGV